MKKVFFSIALIALWGITNAQNEGFSKGNMILSGSLSISSVKDKDFDSKTSSSSFNLGVGNFISKNIAVGINVGIGSDKSTDSTVTTDETSAFAFGAFARYYFTPSNKFSMFGHLGVNSLTITEKVTNPDIKTTGLDFFVAPGFNYFVSKSLSLEATIGRIGYTSSKTKIDNFTSKGVSSFDFGIDLSSINFGMNIRL